MTQNNGNYPPPPYWPERLTNHKPVWRVSSDDLNCFVESDRVSHSYVMDGWPGPCVMVFDDGEFIVWHPALTIERAEKFAESRL